MAQQKPKYASTDPNFGLPDAQKKYASTDPNFGAPGAEALTPSHAPKPPSTLSAAFDFITDLMENGGMGNSYGTKGLGGTLRMAKRELTDPENLSTAGGAAGGIGGFMLGGPAGAIGGATLGGTLASKFGEGKPTGEAIKEGAAEGLYEGIGGGLGKLLQVIGKPVMKGGKALVRHSFGPQNAVTKEFGERVKGDALDALTQLKLDETPIMAPVGGRTAPHLVQRKIQTEGIDPRTRLLAGEAGDRPVSPRAAINPVVTSEGEMVHPLKDVYGRAFGQTNPRSDVRSIGNTVRDALATPTGAGPGHATINNPRMMQYQERVIPGELPPLPEDVASAGYPPHIVDQIRKRLGIDQPTPDTSLWTPKMRDTIPARDAQEMVTGNYRKLDDASAFTNDPSPNASRDALKGMTRGLKEEVGREVPEILPFNDRMAELIPLREALRQAEAQGHTGPMVKLGESLVLAGGRPGLAMGSALNRPRIESMIGQSAYETGKKLLVPSTRQKVQTTTPQLLRLLEVLLGGKR